MQSSEQAFEQFDERVVVHVYPAAGDRPGHGEDQRATLRMSRGELETGIAIKLLVERDESGRVMQIVPLSGSVLVQVRPDES